MRNKSVMLVLGKHKTSATHALTSLSVVEKSAPACLPPSAIWILHLRGNNEKEPTVN